MIIDPKDFRTLLVRIALVTLAVRIAAMLSGDLAPDEAAAAFGLGDGGPSGEWALLLARTWTGVSAGFGFVVRLPALLADVTLPILAVAYARAAGWGVIAGLVAGLVLAMAPLGVATGFRLDGGAPASAAVLLALVLMRLGLRDGDLRRVLASALPLLAVGLLAPPALVVVPAGLYLAWRSVTTDGVRRTGLAVWALVPLAALGIRVVTLGYLVAEPPVAARWTALGLAGQPSGWIFTSPGLAAAEMLSSVLPSGPFGALALQLDVPEAPAWSLLAGVVLLALAVWGLAVGRVQPEPALPARPAVTRDSGVGAQDGWRTLGVVGLSVPRTLGDRDWLPLGLVVLGAAIYGAQAAGRGVADGLMAALAAARPAAALLLGAGLVAFASPRHGSDAQDLALRKRFYWKLGLVALVVFGLGAWMLLQHTHGLDRMAARKVARATREHIEDKGAVLTLGPRGLPVAFALDPLGWEKRVRVSSVDPAEATAHLVELLHSAPPTVVLAGDRDALGATETGPSRPSMQAVRATLDATLRASGYQEVEESHRFLGLSAIVAYARGKDQRPAPGTVVPQLGPTAPPGQQPAP